MFSDLDHCYQDPDVAGRPSLASHYTGVEASMQSALSAIAEHQPIDGFLGMCMLRQPVAAAFLEKPLPEVNSHYAFFPRVSVFQLEKDITCL